MQFVLDCILQTATGHKLILYSIYEMLSVPGANAHCAVSPCGLCTSLGVLDRMCYDLENGLTSATSDGLSTRRGMNCTCDHIRAVFLRSR